MNTNNMQANFNVRPDCDINDLKYLCPSLIVVAGFVVDFAKKKGLPCVFSSIISDRGNVVAKSKTHEQGRAIDLSLKGWPVDRTIELVALLSEVFEEIAALSYRDLEPTIAVYGDQRHLDHIHIQVRPNANLRRVIN